ncbi:MAG: HEAT repeat domain-containing protein [Planctomycetota bacterium]|jgi:HEAT repeat protein
MRLSIRAPVAPLLVALLAALAGPALAGSPAPSEARRRASVLVDLGRLKMELGTPAALEEALSSLKEAAKLDPASIRARFWLGTAHLHAPRGGKASLSSEQVGHAGLEFEAVFKLSSVDTSAGAQDYRRRAIASLDAAAGRLPAAERKKFEKWWGARRRDLAAEHPKADVVHVVARGDTFGGISKKYYGTTASAGVIAKANPRADPRRLLVGQQLTIPDVRLGVARPVPQLDRIDRELVARLGSAGSAAERRAAAERLGLRDCLAAVGSLVEALRNDPSQWVRAECARALGRLGAEGAAPALASALVSDRSAHPRREAARALGRTGGDDSTAALLRAMSDRSSGVRTAAARALGATGAGEAAGPLTAMLSSESAARSRAAAFALRDLSAAGVLPAADLDRTRQLAGGDGARERGAALLVLAVADARLAEKMLPAGLESADAELRRAACEAAADLAAAGAILEPRLVARLLEMTSSEDPGVKIGAALAVARSRKGKAEGRRALLALAGFLSEDRAVRWGDGEPQPVSQLAAAALTALTGKDLPPEADAWREWLEKNR